MEEESEKQEGANGILNEAKNQLKAYFEGTLTNFDLPLHPAGTGFQQKVWNTLMEIPYGKSWSYKQLAIALGDVKCIRAAGTANGKNPLPIVIPCHRVIGTNNTMVGYGGGIWRKEWLLTHEKHPVFSFRQGNLYV